MELEWSVFLWSSICISVVLLFQYLHAEKARNTATSPLPPGPRRWPVVGNMFDLVGEFPHQTLAKLAPKYGAVMSLQIGAVTNVIIQSSKASKEMFKNHDLIYSGRTVTEAMKACGYYQGSMAFAQYGPYWRTMRRLCITELGIVKRVNETIPLRKENIDKMLQWIDEEAQARGVVHVAQFVFLMNFNLLGNILLFRDLFDPQSKEASEFNKRMDEISKWAGQPNLADFFPSLKWLDPQRIQSKVSQEMKGALQIVSGFVKERIEDRRSGKQTQRTDFLDVLLDYEGEGEGEPDKLSERQLAIILLSLLSSSSCMCRVKKSPYGKMIPTDRAGFGLIWFIA
ncbi:hypothetical protein IFM89_026037 [Coptis chinensis]|uniref:Cytochrome P450 n=1 Tax=Coptis chinensis TaxID=261450 RepID=A0A835H6S8_9MAGN|nr:hypothetical protein IFM89_026037 [Coptis chinensis]